MKHRAGAEFGRAADYETAVDYETVKGGELAHISFMERMMAFVLIAGCAAGCVSCQVQSGAEVMLPETEMMQPAAGRMYPGTDMTRPEADLVIYTTQEEAVYEPVIKEFEERTDLLVRIETGSTEELLSFLGELEEKDGADREHPQNGDWDVVFGAGIETLEQMKMYWEPYESPEAAYITETFRCEDYRWTSFSALPLVIMYNTNVVTYRELPVGWMSLLEPRWKGRVAFADPSRLDLYSSALVTAVQTCGRDGKYLERLMENINYSTLDSLQDVNAGILDGRYSVGVTMEESAQALRSDGADVDYIYPEEGTTALPDGTAIFAGCDHPEAARRFLDFTVSQDTQRILVSNLNRRSVRADVPPLPGLSPINRLPLIEMDLRDLSADKEEVLARWKEILLQQRDLQQRDLQQRDSQHGEGGA